jgi:hypothetical protein
MFIRSVAAATLLALAAGAAAQSSPSVVQANREAEARAAGQAAIASDLQAQYDDDMAQYRQQVEAHQIAIARDQAHYDHQQRAYADAMRAWRIQVDACKHGHPRACKAPTPDPAAFW